MPPRPPQTTQVPDAGESVTLSDDWRARRLFPQEKQAILQDQLALDFSGTGDWKHVRVPGNLYADLVALGSVPAHDAPNWALDKVDWVGEEHWIYRCQFTAPYRWFEASDRADHRLEITFGRLDCFARVFVNGKFLGRTHNAFREYTYDVSRILQAGENSICVVFQPTKLVCKALEEAHEPLLGEYCDWRMFARRPQYLSGWGSLAPPVPSVGIGTPPVLRRHHAVAVRDMHVPVKRLNADLAQFKIETEFESFVSDRATLIYKVELLEPGTTMEGTYQSSIVWESARTFRIKPGVFRHAEPVAIKQPLPWEPLAAGPGLRPLYRASVEIRISGQVVGRKGLRFGLRDIDTSGGAEPFLLFINNRETPMLGAVWVPPTLFPYNMTPEMEADWVEMMARHNIGIVRVWGGGEYASEEFYDRCDELGIMVWQDFPYCQAQYPDRMREFWRDIQKEATHQIKRLRNHPSLVMWCGGDGQKDFLFAKSEGRGSWDKEPGGGIAKKLLPTLLDSLDPSRPYLSSSPLPRRPGKGNTATVEALPSFPAAEISSGFLPDFAGDLSNSGPRTRLSRGTLELDLMQPLIDDFRAPNSPEEWVFMSQVLQAREVTRTIDEVRCRTGTALSALLWRLADPWPTMGPSLLDCRGVPKLALWAMRHAMAPIRVVFQPVDDQALRVYAVHTSAMKSLNKNAICRLGAWTLKGDLRGQRDFEIEFNSSGCTEIARAMLLEIGVEDIERCAVVAEIIQGKMIVTSRMHLPAGVRRARLGEPKLRATLQTVLGKRRAIYILSAENLVAGVEFKLEGVPGASIRYENYFDIWPTHEIRVQVDLEGRVEVADLLARARFRCLNDLNLGAGIIWRKLEVTEGDGSDDPTMVGGLRILHRNSGMVPKL
ncbi:MAG: hypothetical protein RLY93_06435 [Sumerlaeia bacterium]